MTGETERADQRYLLLETSFGPCGLAWGSRGIVRLQLPDTTPEVTEARIARGRHKQGLDTLPPAVEHTVAALGRYFVGEPVDFSAIEVELGSISDVQREIYAVLRQIPWGEITTYGELAQRLGTPGGARAIGQAMGRNPVPVIIPCHRVLASGGGLGGFSAPGGRTTKQRLLELERRAAVETLPLFAPR